MPPLLCQPLGVPQHYVEVHQRGWRWEGTLCPVVRVEGGAAKAPCAPTLELSVVLCHVIMHAPPHSTGHHLELISGCWLLKAASWCTALMFQARAAWQSTSHGLAEVLGGSQHVAIWCIGSDDRESTQSCKAMSCVVLLLGVAMKVSGRCCGAGPFS